MSTDALITYLNDHLAGSVAALELLDLLIDLSRDGEGKTYRGLKAEIEQDQAVLQGIIHSLGGKESRVRKAAAWLTEKLGRAKLHVDDSGHGLRTLEALEALGLGIQGKLALWRALAAIAGSHPQLRTLDFAELEARGRDQFDRVDRMRLRAAGMALG